MKYRLFIIFLLSFVQLYAQETFVRSGNFSGIDMKGINAEWGHLTVPENWKNNNGNKVVLAVTILKSANKHAKDGIVFLAGGPGGNAVKSIKKWLNNPVHQSHDIILVDMRGSGFSTPQLCPDLGKSFMEVLGDDDTRQKDIKARVAVANGCKIDLLKRHIDINAYNSTSMAYDLHALKAALGYDKWGVYGVSYGTRIAFEYVKQFPEDVKELVMDSPVTPFAGLYDHNTSNFIRSLNILFKKCKEDKSIVHAYGDIEQLFYSTVDDLNKQPWTFNVSKKIQPSGKFTLNAQDFLLAVQQGIYERKFFEILPAVIKQFHDRNEGMVLQLIGSLKNHLNLDYGAYYCVLCHETLPVNSLESFKKDASSYKGFLAEGLPFYEGDYAVCESWGHDSSTIVDSAKINANFPTLILSGEFDPVIPPESGRTLGKILPNSTVIVCANQGHVPGFTKCGTELISAFLDNQKVDGNCYDKDPVKLAADLKISNGIAKMADVIRRPGLSLSPLVIGLLILLVGLIKVVVWRRPSLMYWLSGIAILLTFFVFSGFVYAINVTAASNLYILALGLPGQYSFLFILPYIISALTLFMLVLLCRKENSKYLFAWFVVFGLSIAIVYCFYWHLFY
ncbi:TAP-like protein [Mucilaginibacter lappiensis]|nr:alpha/beta fold hydrolase [Mucilaginibacter lappiensis]SIS05037.1 TAP-like protein [Mucilaginibacter lappiensis]